MARKTQKTRAKRKSATHRQSADEHAATELVMFIENTSDLSPDGPHGQGHSVLLNALRKWKKGTYDPALAVRLFEYLTEAGAKRYAKEMGSSEKEWSTMFNPATRHEAARQLEESFRSSAEHGEYDHVDTRIGMHETQMRSGMTDQNLVPFHSWPELMTYARAGGPLFYKAPMDHRATRLTKGHGTPNSYEVRPRTLRIWPPGSVGRGRSRTADPFTADAGHLSRFFLPTDEVGGVVHEPGTSEARRSSSRGSSDYPYQTSPTGVYILTRDGQEKMRGTEIEIWQWMHRNLGYSVEHALRYEGWKITPTGETQSSRMRETSSDRPISMTYGQLPPPEKFEHDVRTRIDPDHGNKPYWPSGESFPMELVDSSEIELAESYGLEPFETERRRTGRNSRALGFSVATPAEMHSFLAYLAEEFENGNEAAGDFASTIMTTLGYEWV
jgi:hypothetical protein